MHRKSYNSILLGRFGDPYWRPGDSRIIRESWHVRHDRMDDWCLLGTSGIMVDGNKTNWTLNHHNSWWTSEHLNPRSSSVFCVWEKCFLLHSLYSKRGCHTYTLYLLLFACVPFGQAWQVTLLVLVAWIPRKPKFHRRSAVKDTQKKNNNVHIMYVLVHHKFCYSGTPLKRRAKGLARFARYNKVLFHWGSFSHISLLLGQKKKLLLKVCFIEVPLYQHQNWRISFPNLTCLTTLSLYMKDFSCRLTRS